MVTRLSLLFLALGLCACVDYADSAAPTTTNTPVDENECGVANPPHMVVVTELSFVKADGDVTDGIDIDGRISDRSDELSCRQADFVAPDGTPGIDNQFARVLPALESVAGGDSVQAVIQRTINSGNVLLTFELARVDDALNDSCVEVTVTRALGTPVIGGDGYIEPSQTFDRNPDAPVNSIDDATLENGVLRAGPFNLVMPIVVDNFDVLLDIQNANLRATLHDDGSMEGIIAGAILIPEFVASIENIDASQSVLQLVSRALNNLADMGRNAEGKCEQLSISIGFKATPAFFFEEAQ